LRSLTEQLLQSHTRLDSYERDIGCQLEHTEKLLETLVSEKEKNEQDLRDQLERVTADKVHWHEESKRLRQELIEVERDNEELKQEKRKLEREVECLSDERDLLKVQDKVKY
jgi:cell division protein FtsB